MKRCLRNLLSLAVVLGGTVFVYGQANSPGNDLPEQVMNSTMGSVQLAMSNTDYQVTAGDIYSLSYAANGNPVSYTIPVDTSYRIRVANLAVLDAAGKSYITLKKQVEEIVLKNYPMSGVQFVLVTPASFKVVVKGEVKKTVEKKAWALTRLSEVIFGEGTEYASTRNITVKNASGTEKHYDLYKANRNGDLSQNPFVRPGDIITLNRFVRKVHINGAVERPGSYELMDNENIQELINIYGGGPTVYADLNRVEIQKITESDYVTGERIYLDKDQLAGNFKLNNYDTVYVNSFSDLKPVMFMEGAVKTDSGVILEGSNKLKIRFEQGTNLGQLLRNYAAVVGDSADLDKAYLLRNEEQIAIDLRKILYDSDYYLEMTVEPNDTVIIPFKQYFVTVSGSVHTPGRYPYIPDRTYEYYIGLAGGFDKNKNSGSAVTIKDMNGKKLTKKDIITPETNITAKTNSFTYYFSQYGSLLSTLASLLVSFLSINLYIQQLNK